MMIRSIRHTDKRPGPVTRSLALKPREDRTIGREKLDTLEARRHEGLVEASKSNQPIFSFADVLRNKMAKLLSEGLGEQRDQLCKKCTGERTFELRSLRRFPNKLKYFWA